MKRNQTMARISPFLYKISNGYNVYFSKAVLFLTLLINLMILINYTYLMEYLVIPEKPPPDPLEWAYEALNLKEIVIEEEEVIDPEILKR